MASLFQIVLWMKTPYLRVHSLESDDTALKLEHENSSHKLKVTVFFYISLEAIKIQQGSIQYQTAIPNQK